ncbi:GNAT family N-acetyltransferase [Candidatus Bipolaricaulota bacterium]|nr:GNAT family N-acetyltransferase [Candidatus Bipolaricaulota bacterium]
MFRIREATPQDNEALLRLEAQSPQGTGISIVIDRDDYFYRSRLHDHCKVLIAEEDDQLVGIMAYAIKDVLLNGVPDKAAYFYDLRGEASYRRSMKRGLFRLWKQAHGEMEEAGAAYIYGHVKADNHDSMNISTKMGARIAASSNILTLPSLPGERPALDNHLDRLDEEIARLESYVGVRPLRPVSFGDAYRRGAELGYLRGIFRIEQGDSFAQVSAWDLSRIYRGRVLHMPMSLRILGAVLNPLARVVPVPSIPVVGHQLTYMQLFDPVCKGKGSVALLKKLIQQIRRIAHADRVDMLTLFAYQDDPLYSLPRFFPQKVLHYNTMVRPLRVEALPAPPLYLDIRDV